MVAALLFEVLLPFFFFFFLLSSLIGVASFGGRTSFRGASPFFFGSRVHLGDTQGHTHLVGQVGKGLEGNAKIMTMAVNMADK